MSQSFYIFQKSLTYRFSFNNVLNNYSVRNGINNSTFMYLVNSAETKGENIQRKK